MRALSLTLSLVLTMHSCSVTAELYYDPKDVVVALGYFLASGADKSEATFRFDTINTALQVVSNEANATYVKLQSAYEADDKNLFADTAAYFMHLLSLADELMLDQPERMLGYWIENARKVHDRTPLSLTRKSSSNPKSSPDCTPHPHPHPRPLPLTLFLTLTLTQLGGLFRR